MIEIKHWNGRVLYTAENAETVREAVVGAVLRDAVLRDADLSGADLRDADLRDAVLSGADLRGADLSDAVLSGADLRGADLSGAVLRGADLSGADLRDAVLRDAVLRGADLSGADLRGADLRDAVLRDADLSDAVAALPMIANLDAAILAAIEHSQTLGKVGLDMSQWHACETTHCRAGWAIHLSGPAGYALEERIGPNAAGALIYARNGADRVPNFYASDEDALADMRARAAAKGA